MESSLYSKENPKQVTYPPGEQDALHEEWTTICNTLPFALYNALLCRTFWTTSHVMMGHLVRLLRAEVINPNTPLEELAANMAEFTVERLTINWSEFDAGSTNDSDKYRALLRCHLVRMYRAMLQNIVNQGGFAVTI